MISKCKSLGSKYCNKPKGFIEYSNDVDNIYENNPNKKFKILILFDDVKILMNTIEIKNKKY